MDSNLLKVFVEVCKTQSISNAAKNLHYAQSNVTARIKQLEKSLGHTLFHRSAKGVIPTQAGEKLYIHAQEIIRKLEQTEQLFLHMNHCERLRIASTESNAVTRIVPLLTTLSKTYPDMELELLTGTTEDVLLMLEEYNADAGFICGKPDPKKFTVLKCFDEEMVIVKPLQKSSCTKILGFKKGCAYKDHLQVYLQKQNVRYKTIELGSFETILGCVKAGMGMTVLPVSVIKKLGYEKDVAIESLPKGLSSVHTYMICKKENEPPLGNFLKQVVF
jgi:LysR family transcriptional regulator, cell division regulator